MGAGAHCADVRREQELMCVVSRSNNLGEVTAQLRMEWETLGKFQQKDTLADWTGLNL